MEAAQILAHHCQVYPWSPSCDVFATPGEFMNSVGTPQTDPNTGCESVTLYSVDKLPVLLPRTTDLPLPVHKFM